jgi:rhamnosyltransferase
MTDNYEIAYHLQSYFLVFKKRVIDSTAFKAFWDSVQIEQRKTEVIKKYEVGLTQQLLATGFRACAYAPYSFSSVEVLRAKANRALRQPRLGLKALNRTLRRKELADLARANPTHYFWRELITERKMPFMKVELLRDNPLGIDISDWEEVVSNNCKYDVNLIKRHLARIKGTS